ncbi:hypothetical protein AVDCRST_MAG94-1333 [uncultured Leptolyngbya sp.]|uniref:Uncharacterized protein n=1 Tax=uncultured Leptolyngbya sp. TaxID=332963 RepID=A0A6J4L0R0_9CYAN|nr:hypothetical protein AVDCRST_MAG94-1333 [uncultured Leptolyngbya sp.]
MLIADHVGIKPAPTGILFARNLLRSNHLQQGKRQSLKE